MKMFDEVRFVRVPDPSQGVEVGFEGVVTEFLQGEGISVVVELDDSHGLDSPIVEAAVRDLEVIKPYQGEYDD